MESVQFEAGRSDLQTRCGDKIAKLAAWLEEDQHVVVGLDGHRDDALATDNDPALALRRVEAVRRALVDAGVAEHRIVIGEFGTRQFVCRASVADCRALGRRVDIHATRL
jgi:outer membrane protein OmpA-like peptidoglycan-associated protein